MADQQVALNDLQEYDAEESAANYDDYATVELSGRVHLRNTHVCITFIRGA